MAVEAHLSMPVAQCVLLTQGMLPHLDETDVFRRLAEFWEQRLLDSLQDVQTDEVTERRQELERKQLQPDQVAKLGQALAKTKTAEHMKGLWEVIGKVVTQRSSQLTSNGYAALEDFPNVGKKHVSSVLKKTNNQKSRSTSRADSKQAKTRRKESVSRRQTPSRSRSPSKKRDEKRGQDRKERSRSRESSRAREKKRKERRKERSRS